MMQIVSEFVIQKFCEMNFLIRFQIMEKTINKIEPKIYIVQFRFYLLLILIQIIPYATIYIYIPPFNLNASIIINSTLPRSHISSMASTSFILHKQLFSHRFTAIPPPHSPITNRSSLRISAVYATAERTKTAASCYDVLGIDAGATCQEIKSAHRKLARTLHPDVTANNCGGGETADEFMRVHAAYATLSDPEKRAVYDNTLSWRRPAVTSATDYSRPGRSWETDQCWQRIYIQIEENLPISRLEICIYSLKQKNYEHLIGFG